MTEPKEQIIKKITNIFERYTRSKTKASVLLSPTIAAGKLYESFIVSVVAEKLVNDEKCEIILNNDNFLRLKSSPGPINRSFPRFDVFKNDFKIAEIWTDVEFISLSYIDNYHTRSPLKCEYHEMDILMVDTDIEGRPLINQIWIAIECKNTSFNKKMLRELLGVRRELSLLSLDQRTRFDNWPRRIVNANPPSCLLVYSSDESVLNYASPGELFSIDFQHKSMPYT